MPKITGKTTIAEVINTIPNGYELLAKLGVPCVVCPLGSIEMPYLTLEAVASMYHLDLEKILEQLNKAAAGEVSSYGLIIPYASIRNTTPLRRYKALIKKLFKDPLVLRAAGKSVATGEITVGKVEQSSSHAKTQIDSDRKTEASVDKTSAGEASSSLVSLEAIAYEAPPDNLAIAVALLEFLRYARKKLSASQFECLIKGLDLERLLVVVLKTPIPELLSYLKVNTTAKRLYSAPFYAKSYKLEKHDIFLALGLGLAFAVSVPALLNELSLFMLDTLPSAWYRLRLLLKKCGVSARRCIKLCPPYYRKATKEVYRSSEVVLNLAELLNSKKKAKKYMRILAKRLGIYTKKKKPFKEGKIGRIV